MPEFINNFILGISNGLRANVWYSRGILLTTNNTCPELAKGTTNNEQRTTNNKQRTTNNKQRTTNNKQ